MSSQVQFRRGTAGQTLVFTGAVGEITVNTTSNTLVVHDGVTSGGWPVVGVTQAQTLTNKTLYSATLTGTTSVSSSLIPAANVTYDLGSSTNRFRDLYLSGNTIHLGSSTLQDVAGNLTLTNGSGFTFAVDNTGNTTLGNISAGSDGTSEHRIRGNLVVGIENPTRSSAARLIVSNTEDYDVGPLSNETLGFFVGSDNGNTRVTTATVGTLQSGQQARSMFLGKYARNTHAAPGAVQPGDHLVVFGGMGYNGQEFNTDSVGSAVVSVAQGTTGWSPTSTPAGIVISATPIGSTSAQNIVEFHGNGLAIFKKTIDSTSAVTGTIVTLGGIGALGNIHSGNNIVASKDILSSGNAVISNGVYSNTLTANNASVANTVTATHLVSDDISVATVSADVVTSAANLLFQSSTINFDGNLNFNGDLDVRANLLVDGDHADLVVNTLYGNVVLNPDHFTVEPHTTGIINNVEIGSGIPSSAKFTTVIVEGDSILKDVHITGNTASTSSMTGALVVDGGMGVSGDLYIAGNIVASGNTIIEDTFINKVSITTTDLIYASNSTPSNSTSTGSIVTLGGVGVYGNINLGGSIGVGTDASITGQLSAGTIVSSGGVQNTPIGSVTPSTGEFTTLQATGLTSLGALTASGINSTPIGAGTPSTGAFTSLTASLGFTGTLNTAAQPNVTSLGTLTGLTVNGSTVLQSTLSVTGVSTLGGNLKVNGTTDLLDSTSAAFTVAGGAAIAGNVYLGKVLHIGSSSLGLGLLNPTIIAADNGSQYAQLAMKNTNSLGSADIAVYGDTGADAGGWADIGFTGSAFNDPNFTITKSNDGYFFVQPVSDSFGGNLVLATSNAGNYNDVVVAVGSFDASAEVARFHGNASTGGYFRITTGTSASNVLTGALRVTGGVGVTGNVYAGAVYDNGNRVITGLTSSGSGNLTVTGSAPNKSISLPATGPGALSVGSSTSIPVITTDAYGRVTALSSASISTTLSIAGSNGVGSVALANQTLTISGGVGISSLADGNQTIHLENTGVTSLSSGEPSSIYTAGTDFSSSIQASWYDVSIDLFNVTPTLKAALDALHTGDTFTVYGTLGEVVVATVYLNNGNQDMGDGNWDYWINVTPSQAFNIQSIQIGAAVSTPGNVMLTSNTGNISVLLTEHGPGATTVGSSTSIPVITTDAYGRVTALSTAGITTTLSTSAGTGSGSVALATETLDIAPGLGISTSASNQSITITNTGVLSLNSSGSGNIDVSNATGTVTLGLPATGPGVQTWGGISGAYPIIPIITTDAYGRVSTASNLSLSITSNISGTSGTVGAISNGQTFAFTTTNGMTLTASGNTMAISTPQDIRTSATPAFAGLTTNGNTIINGTSYLGGITSITNNTNSSGYGNGALVVTGGMGVGGRANFGQDVYITGNLYVPNLIATSTATLNTTSPMVYFQVSPLYPYNFDSGFFTHFIGGPANVYAHTGMVRNHNTNYWTFFSNIQTEPSSTTVDFTDAGTIYDTIYAGGLILANSTPSSSTTTGALTVAGGIGVSGNLNVNSAGYFGYNAINTSLTNPSIVGTSSSQAVSSGQYYVQSALINTSSTGSSDIVAYPNNTTDGLTGFMDMGFTGNLFSDPAYTITKANDGYLFASAKSNSALGGNLVLATDKTGTYNDIVVATGSFYANAEVARFHGNASTNGYFQITTGTAASSTSTGALRVTGGVGVTGSVYAGSIYTDNFKFANGSPFVSTTLANTSDITANVSSGSNAGLSLTATGVTAGNYGSATSIPTIVVDNKGRVTSITSNAVSTTISLSAASGSGSVAGGGTLTLNGSGGVTTSVTGSTYTIGLGTLTGLTSSGVVNVTNSTASTNTTTGALVVTGGAGIGGNLYVSGDIYQNGTRVFRSTTTSNIAPINPVPGDEWYNSATDVLYKYINDGDSNQWVDLISASQPSPTLGAVTANSVSVIGGLSAATVTDNGNRVVTSVTPTAGSGISISGLTSAGPAAAFTITNSGVTSAVAGTDITVSGATGAVTISTNSTLATVTSRGATTSTAMTINNTLNMGGHVLPTANVTYNIGATTAWWGTFYGKATQAQYADLAENYQADAEYEPGTVLMFGGDAEVTLAEENTRAVAGVVSTDPAYLMNGLLTGPTVAPIALQGRVPCKVIGAVRKGDLMVSAGNGFAKADNDPKLGTVIGKALENFDGTEGVIEVVVGRV